MIRVRRSQERRYERRRKSEVWLTFLPHDRADPFVDGFGALELFEEHRLPAGVSIPSRRLHDAEIITYVNEGAIAYRDSLGRSGVLQAGEFQRLIAECDLRYRERNVSRTDSARVFRVWLRPSVAGSESGCEQQRFGTAARRDRLCVVASPDARSGSLRLQQDASMYSALLHPGHHVVHELSPGRGAWLHIVRGEVALGGVILTTGDGAGITGERAISLTAREETSLLLVDLGEPVPRVAAQGRAHEEQGLGAGGALFAMLWDTLVDVLGTAATATIVGRAARRALPRSPELAALTISRVGLDYIYVVPPSFDRGSSEPAPLGVFLGELRPLLAEVTGEVVLHRLGQVSELRAWAIASP